MCETKHQTRDDKCRRVPDTKRNLVESRRRDGTVKERAIKYLFQSWNDQRSSHHANREERPSESGIAREIGEGVPRLIGCRGFRNLAGNDARSRSPKLASVGTTPSSAIHNPAIAIPTASAAQLNAHFISGKYPRSHHSTARDHNVLSAYTQYSEPSNNLPCSAPSPTNSTKGSARGISGTASQRLSPVGAATTEVGRDSMAELRESRVNSASDKCSTLGPRRPRKGEYDRRRHFRTTSPRGSRRHCLVNRAQSSGGKLGSHPELCRATFHTPLHETSLESSRFHQSFLACARRRCVALAHVLHHECARERPRPSGRINLGSDRLWYHRA